MLLVAMVAVALLAASPAMAQSAGIENGPKAELKDGVPSATAGGASAKGGECPEATAGGVVAKADGDCQKKPAPAPSPLLLPLRRPLHLHRLHRVLDRRRQSCRRRVVAAQRRCSRSVLAPC